ncbi:MAG: PH domain-containing protein [Pseudomonadota bacterium]
MAVKTENGVTTLTPTAWKWILGGVAIIFMLPGFGLLIGGIFFLVAAGVLQRLELSRDGIKIRNWFSNKLYRWEDIADFRVHRVKSGLITAANMVSFTHVNKEGTMMGKAAKLLVGGTHSIPAVGMKAQKLIQLMQAYKLGYVPEDSPASDMAPPLLTPQPQGAPSQRAQPITPRPRAIPATPRAQALPSKPAATFGNKRKPSTPLVQDGGGLFGRRRPDSPFGS